MAENSSSSFQDLIRSIHDQTNQALHTLALSQEPTYLYEPVRYVLQGEGKRLRPILVHLVGRTFQADPEDLMNAGLAVELLHNFTLVHDDIMDADSTRHGQPTVHARWDEATAILTGDGLYAIAQLLMARVKTNPLQAIRAFNMATLYVCEGQAYDKEFENDQKITLDQYLTMIEKKTGWLIGLCAELGGILGNQEEHILEHLRSYGLNLGKVFQIQDDIFEIFGDEHSMGKSLGSDLATGKQTVLTVLARERNPEEWHTFWKAIEGLELKRAMEKLRTYLTEHGIKTAALELAGTYSRRARQNLQAATRDRERLLKQFTDLILNRKK
jgi:geranylgeranyl pyrophosphate synthase